VKILFLCHRFPYPPNRGGRIRAFNILRQLGRAHEITLATLLRADTDDADVAALDRFTARRVLLRTNEASSWLRMLANVPTATPSSFAYFHSRRFARAIARELSRPYDVVIVHSSSMAPYVAEARAAKVLDFADMDSQKWLAYSRNKPQPVALGYRLEARKLQRVEAQLARRFDLCTCTTRAEIDTLRGYGTAHRTESFVNGVDAEYFRPSPAPYDPNAICFLGHMDYYPNQDAVQWFCDRVFGELRARRPGVTLSIVGAAPSRAVRRLAERPGIRVTGSVPDVRPHAQRAALSVAPLRIARGTQNKILESLAMGVPVVASALAARGTQAVPGEHLLTATTPAEFVAAITRVLDDPHERQRLSLAGRARMLSHHDWAASIRQLDDWIHECVAERRR